MTDFWWISPTQREIYKYVTFSHHEPIREDDQPQSICWDSQTLTIDLATEWRKKFANTNVYRSLKVASAVEAEPQLLGPFLIDIDNECGKLEDALDIAYKATMHLVDHCNVPKEGMKIFFTGHKGFNFEICPQTLGIQGSSSEQIKQSREKLNEIVRFLRGGNSWETTNQVSERGTVIDLVYGGQRSEYELRFRSIRMHDSINCWITKTGKLMARRKIQLTIEDMNKLTMREIIGQSEGYSS